MAKSLGVLLYGRPDHRMRGDLARPGAMNWPVEYGVIAGSFQDLVAGSPEALDNIVQAAQMLEQSGVSLIVGDCGLMSVYQDKLRQIIKVPVVSSSLLLLPILLKILPLNSSIGLITGHAGLLQPKHLGDDGLDLSRVVIYGMEQMRHFRQSVLEGEIWPDYEETRLETLFVAKQMVQMHKNLGAILLECSNLTVFAQEIALETDLPTLSVLSLVNLFDKIELQVR